MTRISEHTGYARIMAPEGVVDLGEVTATLNLDESQSPYGEVTIDAALVPDAAVLASIDPLTHRGLRMVVELRESVGDPVIVSEITADHAGSVASLTAAHGPALTPAKITATYFTAWNETEVRPGGAIRGNMLITARDLDHDTQLMTFTGQTDEALLHAYKLLATTPETSGTLTVRGTVNHALSKIGAALLPGPDDAPVEEPDAIVWEPGTSAWDYARGVAEASGLVVRCDERRRWTLTERGATLPESVSLDAHTGARERVELSDDLWADAVVVKYSWPDPVTGETRVRYATATDSSDPVKVVRIERATPYPGSGAARYWLNRLRARGRVFDLEQVGDYTIRPGMGFTANLPHTAAQVGYVESVSWRVPDDRGTITTRGAADAVPNAIDLWPTGLKIDDLVGKINDLITVGV